MAKTNPETPNVIKKSMHNDHTPNILSQKHGDTYLLPIGIILLFSSIQIYTNFLIWIYNIRSSIKTMYLE